MKTKRTSSEKISLASPFQALKQKKVLDLAKQYYVFEGDVLDVIRIKREYDGIVELEPWDSFDVMNVLAKLLGLRTDYGTRILLRSSLFQRAYTYAHRASCWYAVRVGQSQGCSGQHWCSKVLFHAISARHHRASNYGPDCRLGHGWDCAGTRDNYHKRK